MSWVDRARLNERMPLLLGYWDLSKSPKSPSRKSIRQMQLSHTPAAVSVRFDDPNLVSASGLVPAMRLAHSADLQGLADEHLSVPTDKGANAGLKVASLVAGMVAEADSIDDMALLRHGGMKKLFSKIYAPSTLGSFLRKFTFGHVRQLDAVASRFLTALVGLSWLLGNPQHSSTTPGYALVDVDDTIIEVHGHKKQGVGFGYSRVRGLNALIATLATASTAPIIVAQRLRKGACGSPRGANRLIADAVKQVRRLLPAGTPVLVRMDSAYWGRPSIHAALRGRAEVSVTVKMSSTVKAGIASIEEGAWTPIKYTNAIYDKDSKQWISKAEVAETPFIAFSSMKKSEQVPGRLVVRRIPDFNAAKRAAAGQDGLFDAWRFHAFFTTADAEVLDTVAADKTHRGHAVIEQVNADLKASALAHLPSGIFNANAAWLVLAVMAFNLTRAAATLAGNGLGKATTATIRRKLITVPARIASSARRIVLHLPTAWPWEAAWTDLFNRVNDPPAPIAA